MELGMGFLVGLLAGVVVALITTVIIAVARRAVARNKKKQLPPHGSSDDTQAISYEKYDKTRTPAATQEKTVPKRNAVSGRSNTNTMIVEEVDPSNGQLNKSIHEVRELLLQLAAVISSTENASGQASESFDLARNIIGKIDSHESPELAEAQRTLINEIDRVIQSNARLRSELDKANKGIDEQCQQIEELRQQARIDALTKIPNRAAFDERMEEYISLLNRVKVAFCLLIMDIDFFKNVNDEHGHLNGDRILRGIASRISSSVRTNDFASRYGGEEFAVILPATPIEEASSVAERIRHDIAKTNFCLDDQNIKMTLSGGLAECKPGMTAENIISAADAALYQAKKMGRNRIVINQGTPGNTRLSE